LKKKEVFRIKGCPKCEGCLKIVNDVLKVEIEGEKEGEKVQKDFDEKVPWDFDDYDVMMKDEIKKRGRKRRMVGVDKR